MHNDKKAGAGHAGDIKARELLTGIIAWRDELGELGRELERMLRAAGIEPSSPTIRFEYLPPDAERH